MLQAQPCLIERGVIIAEARILLQTVFTFIQYSVVYYIFITINIGTWYIESDYYTVPG